MAEGPHIRHDRIRLSADASMILQTIGERDEPVLIPDNEERQYRQAKAAYAAMWQELVGPCLRAQALMHEDWIDYLFMIGEQEENPHGIDNKYVQAVKGMSAWLTDKGIDSSSLSIEWTSFYRATAAALLPRYRQAQLECTLDISSGSIALGARADYWPMGQRSFFMIGQRLLLQRLLALYGLRFPVFITRYLDCLDADWSFATWRMILSATGPVVAIDPGRHMHGEMRAMLHDVDWTYPTDIPHFGLSINAGVVHLEPLGDQTRSWVENPPSKRKVEDVPPFINRLLD